MRRQAWLIAAALAASLLVAGAARGGESYRVAVLDFDSGRTKDEKVAEWGGQIADLLAALLATEPDVELVERAAIDRAMREHKLNLTGLVGDGDRVKLGRLVGAQFLVVGRVFPIDKDICIVAKLVGVETSRVTAELVQGPLSGKLAPLVSELAGKMASALRKKARVLLPPPADEPDAVADVRRALGKGALPKVLVSVSETHRGAGPAALADPAAATEIVYILRSSGVEVSEEETEKRIVADWARRYLKDTTAELPSLLAGVDVLIVGEGFSEFGTRTEDLVTCLARLELQAVDVTTGRVLAVERRTSRAVDLAEGIAAKTALQKAASSAAARLVPQAVAEWRKAHPEAQKAPKGGGR